MADTIKIEIVSPEKLVLSEEAQSVSVPGQEGYFTVMGEHAPLMSILKPGFISVTGAAGRQTYYVQGGFADVSPDGVTILAEHAKTGADFDKSEIEAAITMAQEELSKAEELADKDLAQNVLDGWKNLLLEAAQSGTSGAH
ncbi:MAG TPA: F0F1 ATP synthase subunit epsilon [Devosia sp.]|nr:F0F1 ATP synthase subunit epsilon [Devosia sp.]